MAWGGKICLVIKETGIARNVVSPKVSSNVCCTLLLLLCDDDI